MMLSLGFFVFSVQTAAYQQLQKTVSQRWAVSNPIGSGPCYQYLGQGEAAIFLNGIIYPDMTLSLLKNQFQAGTLSLDLIEMMAKSGKAYTLMAGNGVPLGLWLIEQVSQIQSDFYQDGSPRKIEFNLQLKRMDELNLNQLGDLGHFIL